MAKIIEQLNNLSQELMKLGAKDTADTLKDVIKQVVQLADEGGRRLESRIKHRGNRWLVFDSTGKLRGTHKDRRKAVRHLKSLNEVKIM